MTSAARSSPSLQARPSELFQHGRGMSMMEEGDEALGFEHEICWMSEQAEIWLDRVDRTMTDPVHVDRLARTIAALEDIERRAGAQRCAVAASRAGRC